MMLGQINIVAHRVLIARRGNEAANQWLEEHPAVLGGGAIALGALLTFFGVVGLKQGTTTGKWGKEMSGGMAAITSTVRLVAGIGLIGFGIYVLIFGAP